MNYPRPNIYKVIQAPDYIAVPQYRFDWHKAKDRQDILEKYIEGFYTNRALDQNIDNEIQADINAMKIYLSLGYSKTETLEKFREIFTRQAQERNLNAPARVSRHNESVAVDFSSINGLTRLHIPLAQAQPIKFHFYPKPEKFSFKTRMIIKWNKFLIFMYDIIFWLK